MEVSCACATRRLVENLLEVNLQIAQAVAVEMLEEYGDLVMSERGGETFAAHHSAFARNLGRLSVGDWDFDLKLDPRHERDRAVGEEGDA